MSRSTWGVRLASVGGAMLLMTSGVVEAPAARLDSPPALSSRRVEFTWAPDVDDPIYTGNTVAQELGRFTGIHGPGRDVIAATFRGSGDLAWSVAAGEDAIQGWTTADGVVREELFLPVASAVRDVSAHDSDRYALAAFESGEIAFWDRQSAIERPELVRVAQVPLRRVRFVRGLLDVEETRFFVAAEDDTVRYFADPRTLLARVRLSEGTATSLDAVFAPQGVLLAVGASNGRVRAWNMNENPNVPRLSLDGHRAPVIDIIHSPDFSRLASLDDTGEIRVWDLVRGTAHSPPFVVPGARRVAFSGPDGAILFVGLSTGELELRDGATGSLYRSVDTGERMVAFANAGDGRRLLFGDGDGAVVVLRAGRCTASAVDNVCFGGYKVFRSPSTLESEAVLLRSFNYGDSTWTFVGEERGFSDPDSIIARRGPWDPNADPEEPAVIAGPHNGVPYFYSLVRFDNRFFNGSVFEVYQNSIHDGFYRDPGETAPTALAAVAGARTETPLLQQVYVVPSPYERDAPGGDWEGVRRVEFRNLPIEARISIYTLNGDLVRILEHGRDRYGEGRSVTSWDLLNSSGREVVSGVYVFRVETPSGEVVQDYLTLIF